MPTRRFWIRFGQLGQIGRFDDHDAEAHGRSFANGDRLIVASPRGREMGKLVGESNDHNGPSLGRILGAATADDHRRAALARDQQPTCAAALDAIFGVSVWPIDVVDAELTLDDRLVVHYLGPHGFATAGLAALLRDRLGRDIVFQPIGPDIPLTELNSAETESCGAGGCGSCQASSDANGDSNASECGSSGCAGCGVATLSRPRSGSSRVG